MAEDREPTEAELADMTVDQLEAYAAAFDGATDVLEPAAPRRLDAMITVRFTSEELAQLRSLADDAGVKVTALIRSAALADARWQAERIKSLDAKIRVVQESLRSLMAAVTTAR